MKSVAGIFTSRQDAERAVQRLAEIGISREHLTLLTPGDTRRVESLPRDEGEAPGTGTAIGAVTGMATGASVGLPLGAAMSLMIPGVGPILAFGLIGAALFGAGGAAIGSALETALTPGVPRDDLFVYEDALRAGRSVVIALTDDDAVAVRAREILTDAGALDLDTARDRWWAELRDTDRGRYAPDEESAYRCGFEAAQWCDNRENVRPMHGPLVDDPVFQRGWDQGAAYRRERGVTQLRKSA
jgi:hypothetical protein